MMQLAEIPLSKKAHNFL